MNKLFFAVVLLALVGVALANSFKKHHPYGHQPYGYGGYYPSYPSYPSYGYESYGSYPSYGAYGGGYEQGFGRGGYGSY